MGLLERSRLVALLILVLSFAPAWARAQGLPRTQADMVLTSHNLSVSGRGPIRALTEDRI